jgi:hypothetical protein
MRAWLLPLAIASVLVAGAGESRALYGRDDIPYPLRYQVRGVARFVGTRWSGELIREEHEVRARKLEVDVLSIDGPDRFHWEKLLNDGTPLEGAYQDDGAGRVEMHAFTVSHPELDGARFPFDRPNGVVRMNAEELVVREDLSTIRGRRFHQIHRPDLDHLKGRAAFRFHGTRILPAT